MPVALRWFVSYRNLVSQCHAVLQVDDCPPHAGYRAHEL